LPLEILSSSLTFEAPRPQPPPYLQSKHNEFNTSSDVSIMTDVLQVPHKVNHVSDILIPLGCLFSMIFFLNLSTVFAVLVLWF